MKALRELFWFGVAGTLGFVVDTGVLYLLKGWMGLVVGRLFSFLAAVFATWSFNRRLTFKGRHSGLSLWREFVAYLTLMLGGGAVNYGVYLWVVSTWAAAAEQPVIGVAAGSIAGMGVNWASSKFLLFRRQHPTSRPD